MQCIDALKEHVAEMGLNVSCLKSEHAMKSEVLAKGFMQKKQAHIQVFLA